LTLSIYPIFIPGTLSHTKQNEHIIVLLSLSNVLYLVDDVGENFLEIRGSVLMILADDRGGHALIDLWTDH
jgi:hypothetical protein